MSTMNAPRGERRPPDIPSVALLALLLLFTPTAAARTTDDSNAGCGGRLIPCITHGFTTIISAVTSWVGDRVVDVQNVAGNIVTRTTDTLSGIATFVSPRPVVNAARETVSEKADQVGDAAKAAASTTIDAGRAAWLKATGFGKAALQLLTDPIKFIGFVIGAFIWDALGRGARAITYVADTLGSAILQLFASPAVAVSQAAASLRATGAAWGSRLGTVIADFYATTESYLPGLGPFAPLVATLVVSAIIVAPFIAFGIAIKVAWNATLGNLGASPK